MGIYSVFGNFKNNRKKLGIYSGIYGHYPLYCGRMDAPYRSLAGGSPQQPQQSREFINILSLNWNFTFWHSLITNSLRLGHADCRSSLRSIPSSLSSCPRLGTPLELACIFFLSKLVDYIKNNAPKSDSDLVNLVQFVDYVPLGN